MRVKPRRERGCRKTFLPRVQLKPRRGCDCFGANQQIEDSVQKAVRDFVEAARKRVQKGKLCPRQVNCSGQVARQDMQGEFAFDRLEPTAPKAVESLLGTQAAEHRFDDRLALAENAPRLRMLILGVLQARRAPDNLVRVAGYKPAPYPTRSAWVWHLESTVHQTDRVADCPVTVLCEPCSSLISSSGLRYPILSARGFRDSLVHGGEDVNDWYDMRGLSDGRSLFRSIGPNLDHSRRRIGSPRHWAEGERQSVFMCRQ
jgi:hypothetical protein